MRQGTTKHKSENEVLSFKSRMWFRRIITAHVFLAHLTLQGAYAFSISRDSIWIESHSSMRGWGVDVGQCSSDKGHTKQSRAGCGEGPPFFNRKWYLSSGVTKEVHAPQPGEGMVLLVFNQRNARLLLHKIFPLGHYWFFWSDFQWYIKNIAPGRLVVLTISVSGTLGLRHTTAMLAKLGSVLAQHLTLQAHWSWIFIKGGRTISETAVVTNLNNIQQHSALPLCSLSELGLGNSSSIEQSRWQYCATEGAMGELCDEHSPLPLPVPFPPSLGSEAATALANIPVILTAGSRHQYLRHTLTVLLSTPGVQLVDLFVILGDAPPSTIKLLHLLNVSYTILPVSGNYNNKLFTYYRNVYEYVAENFAKAPAVIFLDEDVEVSPDFFSYMSQTLWLLKADPSIYCINAFSATGFRELSYHPSRLFRGSVQVEWGYAISLNFIKEALSIWPKESHGIKVILYDYFLYTFVSKDRECVFPEVGRSFHYGAGTNTMANLITMERAFLNKTLLQDFGVKLSNVDRLSQAHWKEDLQHNISQATVLVGNPCKDNLVTESLNSTQGHSLLVFYHHLDTTEENGIEVPDITQFYHLYSCFGAWSLSEQGQHKGVGILSLATNVTLYIVGVPYSPYSNLKPNWVPLWDVNSIPEEEFIIVDDNMLHRGEFTVHVPNLNMTTTRLISKLSGL